MNNFLNLAEEREKINFGIEVEQLHTKNGIDTQKDAVIRIDNNVVLGVISRKHIIIPYVEVMDTMLKAFTELGLSFQLNESSLLSHGKSLYQEYVIPEIEIVSPDSQKITPLIMVKASYCGVLLSIEFGTYRWSCANSILIGKSINKIVVRGGTSILHNSVINDLKNSLALFVSVGDLYRELNEKDFSDYLWKLLTVDNENVLFKRAVLTNLDNEGAIISHGLSTEQMLENPQEAITIENSISAWTFYNVATFSATHETRSVGSRISAYELISKVFGI